MGTIGTTTTKKLDHSAVMKVVIHSDGVKGLSDAVLQSLADINKFLLRIILQLVYVYDSITAVPGINSIFLDYFVKGIPGIRHQVCFSSTVLLHISPV